MLSAYAAVGIRRPDLPDYRKTPLEIINEICSFFDVPYKQVVSKDRYRKICYARFFCMYFLRTKTSLSLNQIGDMFGNRDHTTVLNALRQLDNFIATEEQARNDFRTLTVYI